MTLHVVPSRVSSSSGIARDSTQDAGLRCVSGAVTYNRRSALPTSDASGEKKSTPEPRVCSQAADNLKYICNVELNNETLIIKRGAGKGAVLISLEEYNSIIETMHLLSSKTNAKRLYESIDQMKNKKVVRRKLIED